MYNDLNLIMREDNLPSVENIYRAMAVHKLSEYHRGEHTLPRAECKPKDNDHTVYRAHANFLHVGDPMTVEIVHSSVESERCYRYCTFRERYSLNDFLYSQCHTQNDQVLAIIRGTITRTPLYVQDAINFVNRTDVTCDQEGVYDHSYTPVMPLSYEHYTPSRYRDELMRADFYESTMDISIHNVDEYESTSMTNLILADKFPYTYIVMVHNCDKVCVLSAIGDHSFMFNRQSLKDDILSCVSVLVYPERLVPNVHTLVLSTLPALGSQNVHTSVYDLQDAQYAWRKKAKPYECSRRPFLASQCDYSGHAFSVARRNNRGLIAQIKYYRYYIACNEYGYYAMDMKTSHRDVFDDGAVPYSVSSTLYFARNTTSRDGTSLMISILDKQDVLYNVRDGLWSTQHLMDMLSYSDKDGVVDRSSTAVVINNTLVDDVNTMIQANIGSTYVNIIHNCSRICIQTRLSDTVEFVPAMDVQRHGLLCLHEIFEADKLAAATQTAAAQKTTQQSVEQSTKQTTTQSTYDAYNVTQNFTQSTNVTQNTTDTLVCDLSCCIHEYADAYSSPQISVSATTMASSVILGACITTGVVASALIIRRGYGVVHNLYTRIFGTSLRNYNSSDSNDINNELDDNAEDAQQATQRSLI